MESRCFPVSQMKCVHTDLAQKGHTIFSIQSRNSEERKAYWFIQMKTLQKGRKTKMFAAVINHQSGSLATVFPLPVTKKHSRIKRRKTNTSFSAIVYESVICVKPGHYRPSSAILGFFKIFHTVNGIWFYFYAFFSEKCFRPYIFIRPFLHQKSFYFV